MLEAYLEMAAWAIAIPLMFAAAELLVPAQKGQSVRRFAFNLFYAPAIFAVAFVSIIAAAPLFTFAREAAGGGLLPSFTGYGYGLLEQVALAFAFAFVLDLCLYVLHRLQHQVPFLWETHRMHHDETALNAAAYARAHPLGMVLVLLFQIPLAFLFGHQYPNALAAFLILRLWGYAIHANLRIDLGPLTPILAGPQWHRLHHSILPEHRDRNFAGMFPAIDMVFGTYCRPRPGEYPPTGLADEPVSNLFAATLQPFAGWRRMLRARRRSRAGSALCPGAREML